jgi:hypothetical protein
MRDMLERFVASLRIPAERKAVVLEELSDHAASAGEAAKREGRDAEQAARAALGDLTALRRALEAVEPGFALTRVQAFVRGLGAALCVAAVLDLGGQATAGLLGSVAVIGIAALCAPPRLLALLRAEFRPRVPVGPAATYVVTVLSVPFMVWTAHIFVRVAAGATRVEVPASAVAFGAAICAVLAVEGVRSRLQKAA